MASQPNRERSVGARSVGGDRKKGGGWWKWLLGLLLLLALIAIIIGLVSSGDDNKDKTASVATTSTPSASAPTTSSAAAAPTTDSGKLTAAGTDLLPVPAGGLKTYVAKDATGTKDKVLSVVTSGFFVGTSDQDRVFVEYGNAVGADEDKQAYKAKVGDVVDLTGPVRPAPKDPAKTFKLDAADAATVTQQGAYVNATTVKTSA